MSRYDIALGKVSNEFPKKQETRIFATDKKVNFVDTNNVFVGYDLSQDCCEQADWFLSGNIEEGIPENIMKSDFLDGYVFDTEFFKEISGSDFEEGGMVVFKLVNIHQEKYLHLFNCHNGYYAHGFEMKINDKKIRFDSI